MRKFLLVFVLLFCPSAAQTAEQVLPEGLFRSVFEDSKKVILQEYQWLEHKLSEEDRESFRQLLKDYIKDHPDSVETGSFHNFLKAHLYDYGIGFHNQDFVVGIQISKYLEQQIAQPYDELGPLTREHYEVNRANRQERLEYLKKNVGGVCNGLAVLWSYGKWLEEDSFSSNSAVKKDDIVFFNKVMRYLALWDGVSQFTNLQKNDIERFIANIIFYQHFYRSMFEKDKNGNASYKDKSVSQKDLPYFLEDTKKGAPHKVFVGTVVGDREILVSRLKLLIKPKTIILVASDDHAMAIYQNLGSSSMYFYDSNDSSGEKKSKNFDWLAYEIFTAMYHKTKPSCANSILAFDFIMYQFEGDPVYEYPTEQNLAITADEFKRLAEDDCFLGDHERIFNNYEKMIRSGGCYFNKGILSRGDPLEAIVSREEYARAFTAAVMRALEGDSLSQEKKNNLVEKVLIRDFYKYVEEPLRQFIFKNYSEVAKRSIARRFRSFME